MVGLIVVSDDSEDSVDGGGEWPWSHGLVMILFSKWLILWVHEYSCSIHSSDSWSSG